MPTRRLFRSALPLRNLSLPFRWGLSALLVLGCFALRYAIFGGTPTLPFLLFFPSIIIASIFLDRGSGFFAVGLSAVLATYFFVHPTQSFTLSSSADTISVLLFVVTGLFIAVMAETLHVAFAEADRAHFTAEAARLRAEAGERERDLMLSEYAHRTKNDLQQIHATLALQAQAGSPEVTEALLAAAERVRVVARVHDRLARSDGQVEVDACEFLHDLVRDLRTQVTDLRPVGLFLQGERHMLAVGRAGAIGLIVNELVTNALKHAFPDDREGAVTVRFQREGGDYVLAVEDDGVGLLPMPPAELQREMRRRGGMGRRLVRALASQLGGAVETRPREPCGTVQTVRFPVVEPGRRQRARYGGD